MNVSKKCCIVLALMLSSSILASSCGANDVEEATTVGSESVAVSMDYVTESLEEINESEADVYRYNENINLAPYLQENMFYLCAEYGVPESIVLSVINTESSFVETASNGICHGYMQISDVNKDWLYEQIGVTNTYDSYQNIKSGIYMIADLYKKYGDWHMALVAYNCGSSGAERDYFSRGEYTSNYSIKVMNQVEYWEGVLKNG